MLYRILWLFLNESNVPCVTAVFTVNGLGSFKDSILLLSRMQPAVNSLFRVTLIVRSNF